jgi:hypothetical protein
MSAVTAACGDLGYFGGIKTPEDLDRHNRKGTSPMTTPRIKSFALSTSYGLAKLACPPWLRTQINFPGDPSRKTRPIARG